MVACTPPHLAAAAAGAAALALLLHLHLFYLHAVGFYSAALTNKLVFCCPCGVFAQVVSWFGTLGFAMPYGVNVADFLLDLAQGEVEGGDFTRLTTAAAAGQQQVYKQQQALQLTADGEDAQQQDRQAKQQQQQSGTAQGVPAAPLSGPAAIQALYSSYETYKRKHPGGFGGEPGQVADLQLALEPPVSRRAAAGDSKRRLGSSVGNGSLIERSLQKAGSFLGLADLGGDKADADSPKQQQQQQGKGVAGAAGISDSDELSDPVEEYDTGDAPEYQRSITRIWSRSRSSSNLFGGGPGDVEAGCCGVVGAPGCAGQLVGSMGLADRGGASYSTQLRVLLQRHIKVSCTGAAAALVLPACAAWYALLLQTWCFGIMLCSRCDSCADAGS
jgi:hypothetical protein